MSDNRPRRGFLERHHRAQDRRRRQSRDGLQPAAMMRLAGLVAAVLIGLAVFVGFDSGRMEGSWLQPLASLDGMTRPVLFGGSILEIAAIAAIAVYAGWALWKSARARRQSLDEPDDNAPLP
ncbi:hypothetical protein [Hyphobacterium sp.]|uniref:hypothetical protein n=1 Tax=Hyphobacterium sp. TaxID=2004662 RepID=UPI003B52279F